MASITHGSVILCTAHQKNALDTRHTSFPHLVCIEQVWCSSFYSVGLFMGGVTPSNKGVDYAATQEIPTD